MYLSQTLPCPWSICTSTPIKAILMVGDSLFQISRDLKYICIVLNEILKLWLSLIIFFAKYSLSL